MNNKFSGMDKTMFVVKWQMNIALVVVVGVVSIVGYLGKRGWDFFWGEIREALRMKIKKYRNHGGLKRKRKRKRKKTLDWPGLLLPPGSSTGIRDYGRCSDSLRRCKRLKARYLSPLIRRYSISIVYFTSRGVRLALGKGHELGISGANRVWQLPNSPHHPC